MTGQIVKLFHPLEFEWREHFSMTTNGECSGLSPIGRATIEALEINSAIAVIARALQIRVGLLALSA
jgi:hypothetical protein